MKKILLSYVPVIHQGYLNFFDRHWDVDFLAIFGPEILRDFDHLVRKDIRAIQASIMAKAISGIGVFKEVKILDNELIREISDAKPVLVLPDEVESWQLVEKHFIDFSDRSVLFEQVFLRWDKKSALARVTVTPDTIGSFTNLTLAFQEAEMSPDWWRQVGAVIARGGEILLVGHNYHLPNNRVTYELGDPRSLFKKGDYIELSVAQHAESGLIASAAAQGIKLDGSDIYVTTFPCPPCAKLIRDARIRRCFFSEGYSMLDGEEILKSGGVEIIHVPLESPSPD